jgi:hypothetical protein
MTTEIAGPAAPEPAATMADMAARLLRARRHAGGLLRHVEAAGLRAEASAARTILELLDGRAP